MPRAIVTQSYLIANPGATFTAAAAATGDSLAIPNFTPGSRASLDSVIRGGATAGAVRVYSPRLHDAVSGIQFYTDKVGTVFLLPREVGQPVYPADVLTVALTGGTAETDVAILRYRFDDLPGAAARLAMYDDIKDMIVNVKPVQIAVTASGTAGQWSDTALNKTEDLLKADTDYAVLGFNTDAQLTCIAIKGPDTGNYRIGGAGADDTYSMPDMLVRESQLHNAPYIPVINSNNKASTFASVVDKANSTTANVQVILAQLAQRFTPSS